MTIERHRDTLRASGIKELHAANAAALYEAIKEAITTEPVRHIEIDLSGTALLDSCGLGTLVALRKLVDRDCGVVHLLNPTPSAQQMLELTRLYRVLKVVKCEEVAATLS